MPGCLLFLNLGGGEVFLILLVILLLFGGKSLPSIARNLGRGIREFKDATNAIQQDLKNNAAELRKEIEKNTNVVEEKAQEVKKDLDSGYF